MDWDDGTDQITWLNTETLNDTIGLNPASTPDLAAPDATPDADQAPPHTFDTGVNVGWYGAQGKIDSVIFLDQTKGAWPWRFGDATGSRGPEAVTLDDNGYVAQMPDSYFATSNLINRSPELDGIAPFTGSFRLYGLGAGEIRIDGNSQQLLRPTDTDDLPTERINGTRYWYVDFNYSSADPKDTGVKLKVLDTQRGNHIRDLDLIHHSHLDEYRAGEIFAPEFLADLDAYDSLRFMQWGAANLYEKDGAGRAIAPEERYIGPDHFTFNTRAGPAQTAYISSAPIEYMVALANKLDADAWISLPVDITDARAQDIAQYVAETLDPELTVYWEYGNEMWNSARGFDGYRYGTLKGGELFDLTGMRAVVEWSAYRGPQLYELIQDEFGSTGIEARFIAPSWAFDAPTLSANSYTEMYFAAAEAQKLADAPPAPAKITTDYAIGLYLGGRDADVSSYIETAYKTNSARAEALARWILFGSDPATSVDLTPAALDGPPATVAYTEGMSISVSQLIRQDTWERNGGVDPLREIYKVLRVKDDLLQYRGVHAERWTTVLVFDEAPGKGIRQMALDVEIVGKGQKVYGDWRTGILSSLETQKWIRLDSHKDFVDGLGLDWAAYEGGVALSGDHPMFRTFRDEGWEALVLEAWFDALEAAGLDLYMHYMSHARDAYDDHWGARDYAGQDLSEVPTAALLQKTALGGQPQQTLSVLAPETTQFDPSAWEGRGAWTLAGDGSATNDRATNHPLISTLRTPVTPGDSYRLSVDIDGSEEDLGDLRIVVRAFRAGVSTLLTWEDSVTAGQSLTLDLGAVPEPREKLEIAFYRRNGRAGSLTLSGLTLTPVAG